METDKYYNEDSPEVLALSRNKQKIFLGGLKSVYKLKNGWIARLNRAENTWQHHNYWQIFANMDDLKNSKMIGGGEDRLTRAIKNSLNSFSIGRY